MKKKREEINPTTNVRTVEGGTKVSAERIPICTRYLLENSNLLNGYGPFIFGPHVGEYVWFDSVKTKTKRYEVAHH